MACQRIEVQFDENGTIKPKQKSCSTCKMQMTCKDLEQQRSINAKTKELEDIVLPMHFLCENYESVFIQFPISVQSIVSDCSYDTENVYQDIGRFCACCITEDGFGDELRLGIYIGLMPYSIISLYDRRNEEIKNRFYPSPCIYIPYFHKVFFGENLRWQFIEKEEDFNVIEDNNEWLEIAKKDFQKMLTEKQKNV